MPRSIEKTEWACKPGSVADDHFSTTAVARRLQQPTRECLTERTTPYRTNPISPCLALLRMGFTWPAESPRPPVRSYRTISPLPVPDESGHRRYLFCGTDPWSRDRSALPTILSCGARTFLPVVATGEPETLANQQHRHGDHPAHSVGRDCWETTATTKGSRRHQSSNSTKPAMLMESAPLTARLSQEHRQI
jgi:hypothetical protein